MKACVGRDANSIQDSRIWSNLLIIHPQLSVFHSLMVVRLGSFVWCDLILVDILWSCWLGLFTSPESPWKRVINLAAIITQLQCTCNRNTNKDIHPDPSHLLRHLVRDSQNGSEDLEEGININYEIGVRQDVCQMSMSPTSHCSQRLSSI